MTRKIILLVLAAIVIFGAIAVYKFFGPQTGFAGNRKYLHIRTDATRQAILDSLKADSIVKNTGDFEMLANRVDYWQHIKPGRYLVPKGMSIFRLVKKLRSGAETPVNLVINKLRLPGDLAKLIGRNFQEDSAGVIAWLDSAGIDHFNRIIPNTYSFPWTYPADRILKKLNSEYETWWNDNNRRSKAKSKGYDPGDIYTIASIVEEETNVAEDKGKIASVYFNRLKNNMPLQADPTIRYALKDFTLNRIYYNQLNVVSPYNTYRNTGLPPGPICTPSPATIEAVLDAPQTDYLYFVANADLRGGSTFTSNLADHSKAAKAYQDSLTAWLLRKAAKDTGDQSP